MLGIETGLMKACPKKKKSRQTGGSRELTGRRQTEGETALQVQKLDNCEINPEKLSPR
jgi:hypothetical protein